MEHILEEQQTFLVFTMDSTQKRWWQPFLKKPYYHVFVIDAWMECGKHFIRITDPVVSFSRWFVNPRNRIFEVVHWYSYMLKYRNLCAENSKGIAPRAIKIKIKLDKYNYIHKLIHKLPLCTVYIAKMFGIATYAITPLQLYKSLKKKGCDNLF